MRDLTLPVVPAFWYVSSNCGDNLTPWLIRKLDKQPCWISEHSPTPKVIICGSILACADGSATVWGAGIGGRDQPVNPSARLLAVRGPLSRQRALECGTPDCPDVYGDLGLLVPAYHPPVGGGRDRVGLLPHFVDQERIFRVYERNGDVLLIDILAPVEDVVDAMLECNVIVSSSLHGLILAVAYGIPFVWVRFSDGVEGGTFKFVDFFLSLTTNIPRYYDCRSAELPAIEDFRRWAQQPPSFDTKRFWDLRPEELR